MAGISNWLQKKRTVCGLCEVGMREGSTMKRVGKDRREEKTKQGYFGEKKIKPCFLNYTHTQKQA